MIESSMFGVVVSFSPSGLVVAAAYITLMMALAMFAFVFDASWRQHVFGIGAANVLIFADTMLHEGMHGVVGWLVGMPPTKFALKSWYAPHTELNMSGIAPDAYLSAAALVAAAGPLASIAFGWLVIRLGVRGRSRTTDAIARIIGGVIIINGVVNFVPLAPNDGWIISLWVRGLF